MIRINISNSVFKMTYLMLSLSLFINACSVNKTIITANDDLKTLIEEAKVNEVFLLKEGVYLNTDEILVPNGVVIEGEDNVIFRRTKQFNGSSIFNLSNASNVTIKKITFELLSNSKGIFSKSIDQTENIILKDIFFKGNLNNDRLKRNEQCNISITLDNILNLEVSNINFRNTFGGIYLSNITKGDISKNNLEKVNFGNIVVSNSKNIKIDNNNISQPGKGSKHQHPSGDGMTFGGDNYDISITNNTISHGYCYLIWVVGSINNSIISDNKFDSGVTTSLCINNGDNVVIKNNEFVYAMANGILLNDNYNNITIEENTFYNDGIISRNGKAVNINIVNNVFKENYKGERFTGVTGKASINKGNLVDFVKSDTLSSIILIDENDEIINSGDTYNLRFREMKFKIKNIGNKKVSFLGFPQVILKDSILVKNSRGDRKSGASANNEFYVSSRNQPNVLTLDQKEITHFTLSCSAEEDFTVLNIPTSFKDFSPFWIKINKTVK